MSRLTWEEIAEAWERGRRHDGELVDGLSSFYPLL